ncbi:hypothetical protein CKO28_22285 [Rhodovibrio sodomensis]|uniref:Uncharacterized protein n=1 Tax=Rhodovibrio sodomensis TaxID=1088 RepID=A0ABS1DJR3_9PROT|nr:hypothetical protein [Rhodovibrio sodomensis]MBK1670750.1 hypothetical protein [Rhodovibrio sodomensis]
MADENEPDDPGAPELAPASGQAGAPACGRVQDLAGDVVAEVTRACPRCAGTGPDCLIDLMYAEAFPSLRSH